MHELSQLRWLTHCEAITLDSVPKAPGELLNQDFANVHPKAHCYFLCTVTYYILAS